MRDEQIGGKSSVIFDPMTLYHYYNGITADASFAIFLTLSDIYFALRQHMFRATAVPLREALIPYFDNVSKSDLHFYHRFQLTYRPIIGAIIFLLDSRRHEDDRP